MKSIAQNFFSWDNLYFISAIYLHKLIFMVYYSTLRCYQGLFSVSMLDSSEYLYFILYWKKSMNMCISVYFNDRLNQINVIKMILFYLHKESGQINQ
jgi:hypothetical protein